MEYNFIDTENIIIAFFSEKNEDFDKCFIVRNVFSRFAIYIVSPQNLDTIKDNIQKKEFGKWIDTIQIITKENDFFIYNDLEKTSSVTEKENVFFSERHIENTNWFIQDTFKLNAPVISFYSFKGGVGRTTATILTAMLLARQGKKVLLVDFDLEAPGLASVFANQSSELLTVKGFVDFWVDYELSKKDMSKLNLDDYYFVRNDQTLVGTQGGELVIVPAISTDEKSAESYIDKLSKINLKYGASKDYIPDLFLEKMENHIKPDYILIDSRTGINDVGGLIFNRYAQIIFMFFYGNQQNMFGLESIATRFKKITEKNVQFYLVNSPIPKNPTDAQKEKEFYLKNSYDIFCKYFYTDTNIPDQEDKTAEHYPLEIYFNEQAQLLDYERLNSLLQSENDYRQLFDIIQNSQVPQSFSAKDTNNNELLENIIRIDKSEGTAEVEYESIEDLKKYFYPRKDYKYIFERNKFLVLGEKGVGKTALFSVLSHAKYANALANFCGIGSQNEPIKWVIGLKIDDEQFPSKQNFDKLFDFSDSELENYWVILLLRQLESFISEFPIIEELKKLSLKNIGEKAKRKGFGEDLQEVLMALNRKLQDQNITLTIVYDHLDKISPDNNLRGKLISALIGFYYNNLNRYSHIRAKIFLRNDIFDREVYITDKVKVRNYAVEIKWDYNQLLNVIWKRLYEQNNKFFENLEPNHTSLFSEPGFHKEEILGIIPKLTEEQHRTLLDKIFGQTMGGNNKTYPYNWIRSHTEDTNNQIHPRTLIKLFAKSAIQEKDYQGKPQDRIIRSKNIEKALIEEVSKHQVEELKEEYPELKEVFENLHKKVEDARLPIKETALKKVLKELNFENDTIEKLKTIGILKEYKSRNSKDELSFTIPDLYLYGLGFKRLRKS